jgi:cytoskeletal protein CcmA (bactofilin family)
MALAAPSTSSSTPLPPASGATPPALGPPEPLVRDTGAVRHASIRAMRWVVTGTTKVTGDATAAEANVTGLLTVGGKLTVTRCTVRGTLEVAGATDIRDHADLDGTFRPMGPVRLASARIKGVLRTSSDLRVDRDLTFEGSLEAPSVHAALLVLAGAATVPGEVVATAKVQATFRGDSTLGPVRAEEVVLKGPPPGLVPTLVRKVFGGAAHVRIDRVEAGRVELEAVDVGVVRAKEIVLGPSAHVTLVEGTVVRQHPTARVGPESRSRPPPGLSR